MEGVRGRGNQEITNMLHPLFSLTAMPSPFPSKPRKLSNHPNPNTSSLSSSSSLTHQPCKHSPSATLDLLILILVLFSCVFLITSSSSYIFRSLSQILPSILHPLSSSFHDYLIPPFADGLLIFLTTSIFFTVGVICLWGGGGGGGGRSRGRSWFGWSRKCENPKCKGLKKAMEFDVQLQTEECLKSLDAVWKEIDDLPWKGGEQGKNPDYECLRSELRKMAPPNGRAVLLFRARCGCSVAKLEGWGPKRCRRHKKGMASLAPEGEDR